MKIVVIGHGDHGKDEFCKRLGLTFASSSMVAVKEIIFPLMSGIYDSVEDCFDDRRYNRVLWDKLITDYNTPDKLRLAKLIFRDNDVYCGLRRKEELEELKSLDFIDYVIWVDASKRKPLEPKTLMTVTRDMADFVVDNNSTLGYLQRNIDDLKKEIGLAPSPTAIVNNFPVHKNMTHDEITRSHKSVKDIIVEWADEVFPDRTITNALTKMVMHEIPEYLSDQTDAMELADIGILLYDIAHLAGVDLDTAIRDKMEINIKRKWEKDEQGLMSHIETEEVVDTTCGNKIKVNITDVGVI